MGFHSPNQVHKICYSRLFRSLETDRREKRTEIRCLRTSLQSCFVTVQSSWSALRETFVNMWNFVLQHSVSQRLPWRVAETPAAGRCGQAFLPAYSFSQLFWKFHFENILCNSDFQIFGYIFWVLPARKPFLYVVLVIFKVFPYPLYFKF